MQQFRGGPVLTQAPKRSSDSGIEIQVATKEHFVLAEEICELIRRAAVARGTGVSKRKPVYIRSKMAEGKAVIALGSNNEVAGFSYIETWDRGKYVANSGLIVSPRFRGMGLARLIMRRAFELSRERYPSAKLFCITTSAAGMKIISDLGYWPTTYSELTSDDAFWQGCRSCQNFSVLTRMKRQVCLCTSMQYDPAAES